MEFSGKKPIYLEIADYICEKILSGSIKQGDKIPSIRDLAVEMEVNPNTIIRSYSFLQTRGIIFNRRGLGYFVEENGRSVAELSKKKEFIENDLPHVFRIMDMLDIDLETFGKIYLEYKNR